jgi:isopenicillin N synthase-like dioxygenase
MRSSVHIASDAVEKFLFGGFVSIKTSDLLRDELRALFRAGQTFFNASVEEKLLNQLPLDTGYRPRGVEYSESPDHPDEMESFSVSRRLTDGETGLHSGSAKILYVQMLEFISSLEPLVESFIASVAMKLTGAPIDQDFHGAFGNWSLLQMNYSRPADTRGDYINDCHEDGCLITITSVTGPGLELKAKDGSFIPMSPIGDELLLMSGEILSLLSGGKVPPTYHRVRPTAGNSERLSLLFFADMHPTLCKPWIINDSNIDIDVGNRVLGNSTRFGLAKWTLE